MAKLVGPVRVASYLAIALAVTVSLAGSSSPLAAGTDAGKLAGRLADKVTGMLAYAKRPKDRSDGDWEKLIKAANKELSEKKKQGAEGWMTDALSWLSETISSPRQISCTKELAVNLPYWQMCNKKYGIAKIAPLDNFEYHYYLSPKFQRLIPGYTQLFFEECGFEQLFQQTIRNVQPITQKHWDLVEYPTLYSYLKKRYGEPATAKIAAVSAITRLGELRNIPTEIECTKALETDLLQWLDETELLREIFELVNEYFVLYSDKCFFRRAIKNIEPTSSNSVVAEILLTLASYSKDREVMDKSDRISVLSITDKLSQLKVMSKEAYCTEEIMETLLELQSMAKTRMLGALIDAYYVHYLNMCGFEERFRTAVDNIKQVSSDGLFSGTFPVLRNCLEEQQKHTDKSHRISVLSVVDKLSRMEVMSEEAYCVQEVADNLFEWRDLFETRLFGTLIDAYLAHYLNICGLEPSFKRADGNINQDSDPNWYYENYSTLFTYIKSLNWKSLDDKRLVLLIKELSEWGSTSTETHCSRELRTNSVKLLFDSREQPDFHKHVKQYFALYLDRCGFEKLFKRRIVNMERNSNEKWASPQHPTLISYLTRKFVTKYEVFAILSYLEEFSGLEDQPKETICTKELTKNLILALTLSYKHLDNHKALLGDYFASYLNKCGFELSFEDRIASMGKDLASHSGLVNYSTLYSYLRHTNWLDTNFDLLFSIFESLMELEGTHQESDCAEKLKQDLSEIMRKIKDGYPELHMLLNEYLSFYTHKCGWHDSGEPKAEVGGVQTVA